MEYTNEIYISDFSKWINEKELISNHTSSDKWETVSYETAQVKGSLLIASKNSYPSPVTITPNLEGYYKIYVCMGDISNGTGHIDLKLSDDEFERTMGAGRLMSYCQWTYTERIEESFWKIADMTNQSITISKPDKGIPYTANIFWIKFVKLTDEETEGYKHKKYQRNMIAHMDGDYHLYDVTNDIHDYCKPIYTMKDSDIGIICEEITNDRCDFSHKYDDYVSRDTLDDIRELNFKDLTERRFEIYKDQIEYAHKYGIQMFAADRMQLSNFAFDLDKPMFYIPFVENHPELRCKARDGSYIDFISYAFKETQDYMMESIHETAKHGFDGVLHIWTRGLSIFFEEPVIKRFEEKYGKEIDCRLLPENDSRLCEIRCDILTEFYKNIRKNLNDFAKDNGTKPLKIYLTCCFDVNSSKYYGIDVEKLAENKLIDGIIQTKLKISENTDGVIDDFGLIDIDKYLEKAKTDCIFERVSGSRMDLISEGMSDYLKIVNKYNLDFYSEIQWEGLKRPEEYVQGAKTVYKAGGKSISLWDCYPCRTTYLSEWNAVSELGNKNKVMEMSEITDAYHKIHKVLSYNGKDVRFFNPSWRG